MGVIIHDTIQTPQGMTMTGLYATFKSTYTLIKKPDNSYTAKSVVYYYYNRIRKPIFSEERSINITVGDLGKNIVELFYNDLCSTLTRYDVILESGQ